MNNLPKDIAKERAYELLKDEIKNLMKTWGNQEISNWLEAICEELEEGI